MQRTGALISRLRKERGMTQMQLADTLDISFQAVSNWERGLSMPDISKLPELAGLFGTTIDALLGRPCPVLEQAAAGRLDEHLQSAAVTVEEAAEAAPFLPPEQAEALTAHVVDHTAANQPHDLSDLLPFMSTAQVDALLKKRLAAGDYALLLPFCSSNAIDAAVQAQVEAGQSITAFLPFMSTNALDAAYRTRQEQGLSTAEFLPFLPMATIDQAALERSERGESFSEYLPFLSNTALMRLLRQRIEHHQSVFMLLPFLPESAIREMAATFIDD
ncbi:MAG: helix-turn-helix transcriptional regulator [Clostridia bacterium]|nr:helix-turn-helix transcriptional regulator [Clostridia bacterium]